MWYYRLYSYTINMSTFIQIIYSVVVCACVFSDALFDVWHPPPPVYPIHSACSPTSSHLSAGSFTGAVNEATHKIRNIWKPENQNQSHCHRHQSDVVSHNPNIDSDVVALADRGPSAAIAVIFRRSKSFVLRAIVCYPLDAALLSSSDQLSYTHCCVNFCSRRVTGQISLCTVRVSTEQVGATINRSSAIRIWPERAGGASVSTQSASGLGYEWCQFLLCYGTMLLVQTLPARH